MTAASTEGTARDPLETPSRWLARGRRAWALAVLLALFQGGLLAHMAWQKSVTLDEPNYLYFGHMVYSGDVSGYMPATPVWSFALLTRLVEPRMGSNLLANLPAQAGDGAYAQRLADEILYKKPPAQLRLTLFMARLGTILAVVLGGLLLWRTAWRFGPVPGFVTHLLWCLSPTLLANGYQAILDAWTAATLCAVLWATVRVLERPSLPRTALVGVFSAMALTTKITTLGGVGLAALALLWAGSRAGPTLGRKALGAAQHSALFGVSTLFTLWALFRFQVGDFYGYRVPMSVFLSTVSTQVSRRSDFTGDNNYLFGQISTEGWWYFYLVCIALKVSIGAQAFGFVRTVAMLKRRGKALLLDALLLAYPLAVLVVMSRAKHQPNISFLLPAFPFVMLWAGQGVQDVARVWGKRALVLCGLFLLASTVEVLRVHPHHQMFFNQWVGGPENGPRYLVNREDFGQDERLLGEWMQRNGVEKVFYGLALQDAPGAWGITYDPNVPCEPTPGIYAIHTRVLYMAVDKPGCLDWLSVEPPDERLGYSIYVWKVDAARIQRLVASRDNKVKPFWESRYLLDHKPAVLQFAAEPLNDKEVRLSWKVKNMSGMVFLVPDPEKGQKFVGLTAEAQGSKVYPREKGGYYFLMGGPGFVTAMAHESGVAFVFPGFTSQPGKNIQLMWNVPEGPVTITDEAGGVVYQGADALGMVQAAFARETTYQLKWARGTATTTVKVAPAAVAADSK